MRKINWDKIKTRLDALLVIDEYLTDPSEDWLRLVIKTEEDYGVRYLKFVTDYYEITVDEALLSKLYNHGYLSEVELEQLIHNSQIR